MTWGWGIDDPLDPIDFEYCTYIPRNRPIEVLYVDLPTGQVSFHSPQRGIGPKYPGTWDGMQHRTSDRIDAAIDMLFGRSTVLFDHWEGEARAAVARDLEAAAAERERHLRERAAQVAVEHERRRRHRVAQISTQPRQAIHWLLRARGNRATLEQAVDGGLTLDEAVVLHGTAEQRRILSELKTEIKGA